LTIANKTLQFKRKYKKDRKKDPTGASVIPRSEGTGAIATSNPRYPVNLSIPSYLSRKTNLTFGPCKQDSFAHPPAGAMMKNTAFAHRIGGNDNDN
jgi:hypothetical protein